MSRRAPVFAVPLLVALVALGHVSVPSTDAHAEESTVHDPLEAPDATMPGSQEIADSIHRLEVPEPRSLREDVESETDRVVTLAADVLFEFDSAELTDRARDQLVDLAAELADVDGPVGVVGHTDSVGADAYNQQLSEQRAEAVAEILRDELGDDADLRVEGRGSDEPVVEESDDDPDAAARNRRVEISHDT